MTLRMALGRLPGPSSAPAALSGGGILLHGILCCSACSHGHVHVSRYHRWKLHVGPGRKASSRQRGEPWGCDEDLESSPCGQRDTHAEIRVVNQCGLGSALGPDIVVALIALDRTRSGDARTCRMDGP